jgi:hypothetical protein
MNITNRKREVSILLTTPKDFLFINLKRFNLYEVPLLIIVARETCLYRSVSPFAPLDLYGDQKEIKHQCPCAL